MVRIPSSLKWLLTRRARLLGLQHQIERKVPIKIDEIRKQLADARNQVCFLDGQLRIAEHTLQKRLEDVAADLSAVDRTIQQYNPEIDPSGTRPIRTQESGMVLRYGQMRRSILEAFKVSIDQDVTTTELAVQVLIQAGIEMPHAEFPEFRHRIRNRLKVLVREGIVISLRRGRNSLDGLWRLSPQAQAQSASPDDAITIASDVC